MNSKTLPDKTINSKESFKMLNKTTFASINKIKNSEKDSNKISLKPPNESLITNPKFINFITKMNPSKENLSNFKPSFDKNIKSKPAEESPVSIKTLPMPHKTLPMLHDKTKNSENDCNLSQENSMIWDVLPKKWKKIMKNLSED